MNILPNLNPESVNLPNYKPEKMEARLPLMTPFNTLTFFKKQYTFKIYYFYFPRYIPYKYLLTFIHSYLCTIPMDKQLDHLLEDVKKESWETCRFAHDINDDCSKQGSVVVEIESPAEVLGGGSPDFPNLSSEIKDCGDKMIKDGYDNNEISV
ncbi:hypothetical protein BDC45DRAFT_565677 [Circinella umbellata]|nr:hypothetical protein BDC45DRAFT_565677 [Circinella umbellata]